MGQSAVKNESMAYEALVSDIKLSVVVPTFRERENLPEIIERLEQIRAQFADLELWVIDDNSADGTEEFLSERQKEKPWVQFLIRREDRGLSTAVAAGFARAQFETMAVMDADLSHPPEKLLEMCAKLKQDSSDMVFGSRYVVGSSVEEDWSAYRWVNSWVATALARPFTRVKDPMSGFFVFRSELYQRAKASLNPVGYKIGLELLVKSRAREIGEVPIHFADRKRGESKLSLKEQINYLRHLRRLANFKFGNFSYIAQFCFVGITGTIVDLSVLTALLSAGLGFGFASFIAIGVAMTSNFFLNHSITFSYARGQKSWWKLYLGFVGACSVGAVINYSVRVGLVSQVAFFKDLPQLAALCGILGAVSFNFALNRYWVFRERSNP